MKVERFHTSCKKPLTASLAPGRTFATRCVLDQGHEGPCKSYVQVLNLAPADRQDTTE